MLRTILAVLAGYVALFLFVMVSFTLLWGVLGAEGSFRPGTTEVTGSWLALSIPLSLVAAIVGGLVAVWAAGTGGADPRGRGRRAVLGLVGVVLVLGLVDALGQTAAQPATSDGAPPPENLTTFEAANHARQPLWITWVLPFLGAAGVAIGGAAALARRSPSPAGAPGTGSREG